MYAPDNYEYYRQRAATERRHAEEAANPNLARLHQQLAAAYEAFVAEIEARPPLQLLVSPESPGPSLARSNSERDAFATGQNDKRNSGEILGTVPEQSSS